MNNKVLNSMDRLFRYRHLACLLLFLVAVSFKMHFSSIGMWDRYIKERSDPAQTYFKIGVDRGLRSDEWLVLSPWYLAQAESGFPEVNKNIRSEGMNMLVAGNVAAFHPVLLGRPQNWGYFFLDSERGFAWWWNLRVVLLFALVLEALLLLTNGKKALSGVGSFAFVLSPALQWWLSTGIVDIVLSFFGIIVSFWFFFRSARKGHKALFAFLFSSFSIGFATMLFPALQVPLFYVMSIFFCWFFLSFRKEIRFDRFDAVFAASSLTLIALVLYAFVFPEGIKAFRTITATVYPGRRIFSGGIDGWPALSYVGNWLFPFKSIPVSNNCEMSGFFSVLPIFPFVILRVLQCRIEGKKLLVLLGAYSFFLLLWTLVPFPQTFARFSLFSFVNRGHLPLGVLLFILTMWLFGIIMDAKPFSMKEAAGVSLLGSGLVYFFLRFTFLYSYLGVIGAFATLVFFGFVFFAFLSGMQKSFLFLVFAFAVVSGGVVNPIGFGLAPITNKVFTRQVTAIKEKFPDAKWAATDASLGNFLVGIGVKSFNGVHYYPDLPMWTKLDPRGSYSEIYNRYAHVSLQLTDKDTYFALTQADTFTVFLSYKDLGKAGIDFFVSSGPLKDRKEFEEVARIENDKIYIYKIKDS